MYTHLVQIALACVAAAAGLAAGDLVAQPYPSRPIRVIDAYPPGGSTDVVARIIAAKFQESTGQIGEGIDCAGKGKTRFI